MFFVDFWSIFPLIQKKKGKAMVDIESLIPHRKPIRIISEVLDLEDNAGSAAALVDERWPLCDSRGVRSLVLIEAVAQTAAVVAGNKRRKEGKGGTKGWLVGIKSADFKKDVIPLGTRITVFTRSLYAMEHYAVIEGIVKAGDEVLLSAVLQAMELSPDVS
jgi:predicted hotdog family 3-hydroxylacyl-ACP dehydratase